MFGDDAKSKAKGQQGKTAESKVREYLQKIGDSRQDFDWHRGYDARSAGGKFQRIAGDFSYYSPERHGIIEVKEVAHDFRLPFDNFEKHQVAKCRLRMMAGGEVIVLIYHSTTKLWRRPGFEAFLTREGPPHGSWDLREYATFEKMPDMYL